jgi:hypothetical protein
VRNSSNRSQRSPSRTKPVIRVVAFSAPSYTLVRM